MLVRGPQRQRSSMVGSDSFSSSETAQVSKRANDQMYDHSCFLDACVDGRGQRAARRSDRVLFWKWYHIHRPAGRQGGTGQGQVVNRLRLDRPRLPRMAYDTGADVS
jgi:hypothetical protein